MKMFAKVNGHHLKLTDIAGTIDANYYKGLSAHQERTAIYEVVCGHKCRGGTTEICRAIKARYGNFGSKESLPKHKGESSGIMETLKIKDATSRGFTECPVGGGGGHGFP